MKRLFTALILVCASARAQSITWIKWDPEAVRSDRIEPGTVELVTVGAVAGVRIDYDGGGSLTLTPAGANHWTGSVPAVQLLHDYHADDVNHNFVGFIRLLDTASQTLASYNAFVDVIDSRIPSAAIRQIDTSTRATARILNLYRPAIGQNDVLAAVRQLYTYYLDDFDFVQVVFALPSYPANRYHFAVRNDVQGIGLPIENHAADYGSAGRLQGISVFPVDFFFDAAESAFLHELGHQWINYTHHPLLAPGSPHWPPSTMAQGIMGFNIPGTNVGGTFTWHLEMASSTTARVTFAPETKLFNDLDLYLMGFISASSVSPQIVVQGTPCDGCVLPASQITAADVIAVDGARIPDWRASKKAFTMATVVVSRDRLLNDDEMAFFEYFAERGEATEPLPFTAGFARGTTYPFYVATRGIGQLNLRLEHRPRRRATRH